MKTYCHKFLAICLLVGIAACSPKPQEKEKESQPGEMRPESAHAIGSAPGSNAGLKFTPPSDWIPETPTSSSSSRKAQYKLPRAQGDTEDAELIVYYFAGGGGTPQANIERWIAQFTGPDGKPASGSAKITNKTIDNIPMTIVDVRGTYSSSMGSMQPGGQPKPGFRMLGAIAETANGPWFVKLTGPERTVARYEPGFESFLDSVKQGD